MMICISTSQAVRNCCWLVYSARPRTSTIMLTPAAEHVEPPPETEQYQQWVKMAALSEVTAGNGKGCCAGLRAWRAMTGCP